MTQPVLTLRFAFLFLLAFLSDFAAIPTSELAVVECSKESGLSNYFLRAIALDKTSGETARKRLRTQASDGIALIEWSEREYGTDVYFWSNGKFHPPHIDRWQKLRRKGS